MKHMKPLAFFLIEWITDYINTPKIEQTPATRNIILYSYCNLADCSINYICDNRKSDFLEKRW